MAYDTLKIARQLTQAGLDPKVAEGVSETFAGVLVEREDSLATKSDLQKTEAALRSDLQKTEAALRSEIAGLRGEINGEITGVKGEITGLRGEIAGVKGEIAILRNEMLGMRHELRGEIKQANVDQIRWLIGAMVAISGLLFAAIKLL